MTTVRQRDTPVEKPAGFILAGGRSRRMGQDKALLDWHGRPLLQHMTCLLSTVADPVRVVGREQLPDSIPGIGPIGGILTALNATETDFFIVTALDLPLLTKSFLRDFTLRLMRSSHLLLACKVGSRYPLCLGLHRDLRPDVESAIRLSRLSIQALIENSNPEIIQDAPPEIFRNLNTPQDYHRSLAIRQPEDPDTESWP